MTSLKSLPLQQWFKFLKLHPQLWLLLLLPLFLLALATPWVLWAHNVERAGEWMEEAIRWPEPRQPDTLPELSDREALDRALAHFAAAIKWRPAHYHAYRQAAHGYIASEDWFRAAELLEKAQELAPHHPLVTWESWLVYQQMVKEIEKAPRTLLVPLLSQSPIEAPELVVETPFCEQGEPERCYAGETLFTLPYAGYPDTELTAPTLFLHAPARVRSSIVVPEEQPALRFLVGLSPLAREWGSDGATLQLWLEAEGEPGRLLYEQTLDSETAVAGWTPGWVDLSPWAGQRVTLVFGTAAGPAGRAEGDWYGWGDVQLTTVEAARYASLLPAARVAELWPPPRLQVD